MNKPEQQTDEDDADPRGANQAETGETLQAITDAMEHPEFDAEQLPALWQQAMEPDDIVFEQVGAWNAWLGVWNDRIEAMYRRCATYPQHTKISVVLSGMPPNTWHDTGWDAAQAHDLLRQATPAQLRQALEYERQHPKAQWSTSAHIMTWADIEQLTGQIIEQLEWNSVIATRATTPGDEHRRFDRWCHISEHIQQQLLGGDNNAWTVFHGIVEPGTRIGDAVELANTIEQQTPYGPKPG